MLERSFYDKMPNLSITDLRQMLDKGEITCEELVLSFLERISRYDKTGIKLNAVRELNPDALEQARCCDNILQKGRTIGPLHGIPILLKDCIDTKDRTHTTCGAVVMENHYASKDAFIVKKLRKAGAIILGKANMSEWYGFCSTKAPSGYSAIAGGSMLNPYGPNTLKPGGSSGGCAVAVSAGFSAAAIGTETSGSIIEPSYFCSVVGFKPTVGLISRSGILPVMTSQDSPGPITKNVTDAAVIMSVMVSRDKSDIATWRADEIDTSYFVSKINDGSLKGKRIGITRDGYYDDLSEMEKIVFDRAIDMLRDGGAVIIDNVPDFLPGQIKKYPEKYSMKLTSTIMCHAFKVRFNHYLANIGNDVPVHSLKELIEWNISHPWAIPLGQDYLEEIEAIKNPLTGPEFFEAIKNDRYICGEKGITGALAKHSLDAIIMPGVSGQGIAPRTGNPIITMPAGYTENGVPVGINLVGHFMGDIDLLCLARSCERVLPERIPPKI